MFEAILNWISIPYMVTFILMSYLILKYTVAKEIKVFGLIIDKAYLVLIIAMIFAVPFFFLIDGENTFVIRKLLVTYTVGTSFYELIVKKILAFLESK